eukprot:Hpha_TRINITY_DN6549_c0_g1::TRINITY_DN6549_c0_g1_i1::g.45898::m.45898
MPPHLELVESLRKAAAAGDLKLVEELLSAGAPPDSAAADGSTALHAAVKSKHKSAVAVTECLLRAGANPGIPDSFGVTAHEAAAASGSAELLAVFDTKDRKKGKGKGEVESCWRFFPSKKQIVIIAVSWWIVFWCISEMYNTISELAFFYEH